MVTAKTYFSSFKKVVDPYLMDLAMFCLDHHLTITRDTSEQDDEWTSLLEIESTNDDIKHGFHISILKKATNGFNAYIWMSVDNLPATIAGKNENFHIAKNMF